MTRANAIEDNVMRWKQLSRFLLVPVATGLLMTAAAGGAAAQEIHRPDQEGIEVSPETRRLLEGDPHALQFKRAWKPKVQRVQEQRKSLERRVGPQLGVSSLQAAAAAVTGVLEIPVGLGLYAGATAPYTAAQYDSVLFSHATTPYSVRTFYRENSGGVFEVGGQAFGWASLPQNAAYYEPSSTTDPTFGRTAEYLRDVLNALDGTVDFGQYDNDGPDGVPNSGDDDGYVDVMAFVYPNWAASCGGPGIWPHRWHYGGWWGAPYSTGDAANGGGNILVDDYTIQAGLDCDGVSLMDIGTFAHETGHALALPDLYDTDYSSAGIGHWGLMASGGWNTQTSPAHMSAWSKDFLGWLSIQTISSSQDGVILDPVYDGVALRYDIPGTAEYYLLEHRGAVGSDQHVHGEGLLIWHIDQDVIDANIFDNTVNDDESRKGVDLEEADGFDHLDTEVNRGDGGDVFPGTSGNTSFSLASYPTADSNDGLSSGLFLSNIARDGFGVLSFDVATFEDGGPIAFGDSVFGALSNGMEQDTFELSLTSGQVIDVAAFNAGDPWWLPQLTLLDPVGDTASVGMLLRNTDGVEAWAIAAYAVPTTGTYKVIVNDYWQDWGGPYLLKTRASGALITSEPFRALNTLAQANGPVVQDTFYIWNAGTGSVGFEVSVDGGPSWISVAPLTGTISPASGPVAMAGSEGAGAGRLLDPSDAAADPAAAPTRPDAPLARGPSLQAVSDPQMAPVGAVPVVVSIDPTGQTGNLFALLRVSVPTDPWGGEAVLNVNVHLFDEQIQVVDADFNAGNYGYGIAGMPDGTLAASQGWDLMTVDPATGGSTLRVFDLWPNGYPGGMVLGTDGVLYAGDWWDGVLLAVDPFNAVDTLPYPYADAQDVAYAPDGTLYVSGWNTGIVRINPDMTEQVYSTGEGLPLGIAFNPMDGWVYFGRDDGTLARLDPATGFVDVVADPAWFLYDLAIGESGLVYAAGYGRVWIFDPASRSAIDWFAAPFSLGITLQDGFLAGTSYGWGPLWRMPVADGPVDLTATYLTAAFPAEVTVPVGGGATLEVEVSTVTGAAIDWSLSESATWLTPTATAGTTPHGFQFSFDATGLAEGVYEELVSVSSTSAANSPLERLVRLRVTSEFITIGSSTDGTISTVGERDTFYISLAATDTIDISLASPDETMDPWVEVYGPDGAMLAENDDFHGVNSLIPAFIPPTTGTYTIVARAYEDHHTGNYQLRIRDAFPIPGLDPGFVPTQVAEGSGLQVADTVYLFNLGAGSATWTATSEQSWLSFSPSSGTLATTASPSAVAAVRERLSADAKTGTGGDEGPALEAGRTAPPQLVMVSDPALAPEGSIAVQILVDPAGLAQGFHESLGFFALEGDTWGMGSNMNVQLKVFDPAITVVAELGQALGGVAVLPDSSPVVGQGGSLTRVDRATGATSFWGAGPGPQLWGNFLETDTSVISGTYSAGDVYRITPTGHDTLTIGLPWGALDVTRTADGTVYIAGNDGLYELPVGSTTATKVVPENAWIYAAAYHPFNGWVYFSDGFELRRYAPASGAVETLAYEGPWIVDMVVGRSGMIYADLESGADIGVAADLAILDDAGNTLELIHTPNPAWNGFITLGEGVLWGTGGGVSNGAVYQYPVTDGPVSATDTYITLSPIPTVEIAAGGSTSEVVTVSMSDGSSLSASVSTTASWLSPSPIGGTTPFDVTLTYDATALMAGTLYEDTLTVTAAGAANDPLKAVVRLLTDEATSLALNDSTAGRIYPVMDEDTVQISLTAGQVVDFAAFNTGDTEWEPLLLLLDPSGNVIWGDAGFRWAPTAAIIPAFTIGVSGTYSLVISDYWGEATGDYLLKARTSGPVLATYPWMYRPVAAAQGGAAATDTIWVFNASTGSTTWSVSTDGSPWMSVSPTTGSLSPSGEAATLLARESSAAAMAARASGDTSGRKTRPAKSALFTDAGERVESGIQLFPSELEAPAGSTPIVVTVDPTGYTDDQFGVVTISPADRWGGDVNVLVHMRLYDNRIQIVTTALPEVWTGHAGVGVLGAPLALGADADLVQVDTISGAVTDLVAGAFVTDSTPNGILAHPDGQVYVATARGRIMKIGTDHSVSTLYDGVYFEDLSLYRDGTVLVAGDEGIFQIFPDNTIDQLHDEFTNGIAYSPFDGWAYFTAGPDGDLFRAHPESGGEPEYLDSFGGYAWSLEVGRSGLVYAAGEFGIAVYDAAADAVVDHYPTPHPIAGVGLGEGWLWATTFAEGWAIRIPVSDGPANPATDPFLVAHGLPTPFLIPLGGSASGSMVVEFTNGATDGAKVVAVDANVSVAPDSGAAPFSTQVTVDGAGLAEGEYTGRVTLNSTAALNSGVEVPFRYVVSGSVVALGDSVKGTLDGFGDTNEYFISLAAGQPVDFAAFADVGNGVIPWLEVYDPDGTLVAWDAYFRDWAVLPEGSRFGAVIPGFTPEQSGPYTLLVGSVNDSAGGFTLKAREAGPVVVTEPWSWKYVAAPVGGTSTDTIYVYNAGQGAADFEVLTYADATWLSVSPASGTLPAAPAAVAAMEAGAGAAGTHEGRMIRKQTAENSPVGLASGSDVQVFTDAATAPAGAVPVVLTMNAAGLPLGGQPWTTIRFRLADDWAGQAAVHVRLQVHDAEWVKVASGFEGILWGIGQGPDGGLLVGEDGGRTWRVDPQTGERSLFHQLGSGFTITDYALGADGRVYIADANNGRVISVSEDGADQREELQAGSFIRGIAVDPDGTVLALTYYDLFKKAPDGTVTFTTAPPTFGNRGMGYDPRTRTAWVSNSETDAIYEVDIDAGTWTAHSQSVQLFSNDLTVGSSGKVYYSHASDLHAHGGELFYLDSGVTAAPVTTVAAAPVDRDAMARNARLATRKSGRQAPAAFEAGPASTVGVTTGSFIPEPVSTGMILGRGKLYVNGAYNGNVYMLPQPDTGVTATSAARAWVAVDDVVASGQSIEVALEVDLSEVGEGVGSFGASLTYDPAVLSYVSATAGDFGGTFNVDAGSAGSGTLGFTGSGGATVLDTTTIALVTFQVVGGSGAVDTLRTTFSSLIGTGGTDLTSAVETREGVYRVTPGVVNAGIVTAADSMVRGTSQSVDFTLDLNDYSGLVGSADGTVSLNTGVLQVDSITAGSYGGTLTANLAMQADSGFVRWAVANATPPADETFSLIRVWVSAVTENGAPGFLDVAVEELTDDGGGDLMTYLQGDLSLTIEAAAGVWGDLDYTWRTAPTQPAISARDALICLNVVVEKDMSEYDTAACDVAPNDGTNYTGQVTASDALNILKHVVNMSTAGTRVGVKRAP